MRTTVKWKERRLNSFQKLLVVSRKILPKSVEEGCQKVLRGWVCCSPTRPLEGAEIAEIMRLFSTDELTLLHPADQNSRHTQVKNQHGLCTRYKELKGYSSCTQTYSSSPG